MRRRVVTVAKLALGLGLLAALLLWGDTASRLVDLLLGFDARYLAELFAVVLGMRLASAVKWWILLHAMGTRLPLVRLLGLYLIGQFFNNFMPSMIGGDVTKSFLLGRQIRSQTR
ncbi:MAG: lysylphosphatidylglycerol synthase domain-containing protein, partial [Kiloniellaceae bacterium]